MDRKEQIKKEEKDCIGFMDCLVTDFLNDTKELTEEEILQMVHERR